MKNTISHPAGFPARKAALDVLESVLRRRRPLDAALDEVLKTAKLAPRDAGFAHAIAAMSLRRFGQLQALVHGFVAKPPPPHKAGPTLEILIAGACELVFMGAAPHAAVDGANRLAASDVKAVHFKGLINAVLRRIAHEGAAIAAAQDAAALNTPDWLWERLCETYGEETARAIAAAHLELPPLDLTLKTPDDPYADIIGAQSLAPGRLRLAEAGRIEDIAGYAQGRWWVQDFAASLVVELCGEVCGKKVIDLCAAPGGKTAQLAARGALVTAVELSPDRLRRLKQNLSRLQLNAELIAADAREWRPEEPAPIVLLDAPCTATGTIRRHPDLPWLKSAADLTMSEGLQSELLDAAAAMTAPGGTLVYAVCSLEPDEGVAQVEAFLSRQKNFVRRPVTAAEVFGAEFVSPEGDLKTLPSYWPDGGGMDGFYAARLRRAV
jgi:16S rRNA (cytosine967-C5)-methyltransferase